MASWPRLAWGQQARVRLVYADYQPFSWMDGDKPAGIEIDIADELFGRRLGFKVEHRILPWARAQHEVSVGEADAFFAAATPARLEFAAPVGPTLLNWQVAAFARRNNTRFSANQELQLSQLCAYRLGAVRGNGWVKTQLICHDKVEPASSTDKLLHMLLLDRFELIIEDRLVLHSMAKKIQVDKQIRELKLNTESAAITLLLGLSSPLLKQTGRIEAALLSIVRDGSLQKMIQKHSGEAP